MKRFICLFSVLACLLFNANAQMQPGEAIVDLGIGVGMVGDEHNNKAAFTQHLGMEWCILTDLPMKTYLTAGFNINNSVAGFGDMMLTGTYKYNYTTTITYRYPNQPSKNRTETREHTRSGLGTCKSKLTREDVNIMPVATIHYPVSSKLDLCLTVGLGIGILNNVFGEKSDLDGFSSANYKETAGSSSTFFVTSQYSYDDLAHVKWVDVKKTYACFSAACYLTARYSLTENWGVEGQFGLIGGNFKKSVGSSYNLLSFGATYRF